MAYEIDGLFSALPPFEIGFSRHGKDEIDVAMASLIASLRPQAEKIPPTDTFGSKWKNFLTEYNGKPMRIEWLLSEDEPLIHESGVFPRFKQSYYVYNPKDPTTEAWIQYIQNPSPVEIIRLKNFSELEPEDIINPTPPQVTSGIIVPKCGEIRLITRRSNGVESLEAIYDCIVGGWAIWCYSENVGNTRLDDQLIEDYEPTKDDYNSLRHPLQMLRGALEFINKAKRLS